MRKEFLRTVFLFFITAMALMAGNPGLAPASPSILHHDLRVRLLPNSQALRAADTLTLRPNGADDIVLVLSPRVTVRDVSLRGKPVQFSVASGELTISIPGAFRNKELSLTVRYEGQFTDRAPENPVNTENPSYGVAGTISSRGVFLSGGAGWYPDLNRPGAATFTLHLEAPEGWQGVTSGRRENPEGESSAKGTTWVAPYPLRSLSLAAGHYRISEEKAGKIPVYVYFYPESEDLARNYLGAARDYLNLYQGLLGPYPFEKFAVVENFFPTGYGFPSWTLLGSTVIQLPFIIKTSLGHEIAHSWWGNGVWVDYSRGNWCEGLTTYVADYLYKERESKEKAREYRLNILRDYATLVPPDEGFPLSEFTNRTSALSQAIGYGKCAMVFHMARKLVGDKAFWAGLREVVRTRLFRNTSWDAFAKAFGEKGNRPMGSFFRQWVERPGAPVLSLSEVKAVKTGNGWQVSGFLFQKPPFFDLSVPLELETSRGQVRALISSQGASAHFVLKTQAPPVRLMADPDVDLFRRLAPSEIPPTVNSIRGSTSLLVIAAHGLSPQTLTGARILLAGLGREDIPILQEDNVSPQMLQGHDILFLGVPVDGKLLGSWPSGLKVSQDSFALNGNPYDEAGDALFAALPHPNDPDRTAAIYLPLSARAAEAAARKIPHYGKYSYLVFVDGVNRDKGTWPVTRSPMIVRFGKVE
jgi:aminopeptidase N